MLKHNAETYLNSLIHKIINFLFCFVQSIFVDTVLCRVFIFIKIASTSTENLALVSRLSRAPSLPRSYNRNRSGIPVAHKEPTPKGCQFELHPNC